MKKLILSGLLAGLAVAASGQGILALNNADNPSTSTTSATSGGLFFLDTGSGPAKIATDFNAVFLNGTTTIASFIGNGAIGDNGAGPGYFYDSSGTVYTIAGVPSGTFPLTIQAWIGTATDYASATTKGTVTYNQRVADPTAQPPPLASTLVDMPSLILSGAAPVPEPSTFALAGLGAAALWIFRRRK